MSREIDEREDSPESVLELVNSSSLRKQKELSWPLAFLNQFYKRFQGQKTKFMKYLGIDYGEAKIGLAVSDGEIATPEGTIGNGQNYAIARFCQENKIEKIIIGLSEGKMAEKTKRFGLELVKITNLPVEYQDETLTSQTATKKMVEAGKKRSQRKFDQHAFSAALILQDWLERD